MDSFLFLFFSLGVLFTAIKTIAHKNPVYGALYLVLTMIGLSALFFLLDAQFLAGLQLVIYAGAVLVLFVMVLMLFDFKKESSAFFRNYNWLPLVFLFGIISGVISLIAFSSIPKNHSIKLFRAENIAIQIFTKYVFLFEILGLLLLVIAIGVVALSRLDKD